MTDYKNLVIPEDNPGIFRMIFEGVLFAASLVMLGLFLCLLSVV